MRKTSLLILCALGTTLALVAVGCSGDDVGVCCKVLPGRDEVDIPTAAFNADGEPIDDIRINPAYDCDFLTCVSFQATAADRGSYCTKSCEFDSNCPEGFTCASVLQSDPGPDATIQPEDKFCVRADHVCE